MKRQHSPNKVDDEQPAQRRKTHPRASSPGLSGSDDGEDDEFENEPDDNVSKIPDNVNNLIPTQAISLLKFTTALKNCFLTSERGFRSSNTSCSMGGILSKRTQMSHLKIELK